MKYVKIHLHGGGSYVQPVSELANAIDGELDALEDEGQITITFEPVYISDAEYANLPEFTGH